MRWPDALGVGVYRPASLALAAEFLGLLLVPDERGQILDAAMILDEPEEVRGDAARLG